MKTIIFIVLTFSSFAHAKICITDYKELSETNYEDLAFELSQENNLYYASLDRPYCKDLHNFQKRLEAISIVMGAAGTYLACSGVLTSAGIITATGAAGLGLLSIQLQDIPCRSDKERLMQEELKVEICDELSATGIICKPQFIDFIKRLPIPYRET